MPILILLIAIPNAKPNMMAKIKATSPLFVSGLCCAAMFYFSTSPQTPLQSRVASASAVAQ
jgi:hypothetical protein